MSEAARTADAIRRTPVERTLSESGTTVKLTARASQSDRDLLVITLSRILVTRTLAEMGVVANDEE